MGALDRYRSQLPNRSADIAAVVARGETDEAHVDAEVGVAHAVLDGVTGLGDRAIVDVALLAHRAEAAANDSRLAQAAVASMFDQVALEMQVTVHRGSEKIRGAGDRRRGR